MIEACGDERGNDALKKAVRLLSVDGLDGAMMVVEKELESNPESWEARCAKADILYLQGLYGASLQWSEKSLALNPNNALAWNTKGNALYKLGRYKEAIECYGKAIEIEQNISSITPKDLIIEQISGGYRVSFAYDKEIPFFGPAYLLIT